MVLTLFGSPQSPSTWRVLVVIEELNIPYQYITIDFAKREQKSATVTAVQPFGQVPYIDDDGFKLFESRAIARYLALKYGGIGKLVPDPADLQKTALFEQAASIELTHFDPPAFGLGLEGVIKPLGLGLQTDHSLVEALTKTLHEKIAIYEVLLSKTKYLAGDEITIVDLFHLPYGSYLKILGIDFLESGKFPNVSRWWNNLASLPSWKKAHPV